LAGFVGDESDSFHLSRRLGSVESEEEKRDAAKQKNEDIFLMFFDGFCFRKNHAFEL
jgi:hypothetical protein